MYEAFAKEERSLVVVNAFSLNPGVSALEQQITGVVLFLEYLPEWPDSLMVLIKGMTHLLTIRGYDCLSPQFL